MNVRVFRLALFALLAATFAVPAGAADTEGGSTEIKAQSGCLNQWMFNGMWRVRVTAVTYSPKTDAEPNSWDVTMQWRNGTAIDGLLPTFTSIQDLVLAFKSGDTLSASATTDGTLNQQKLQYHEFPPSGQFTYTQHFFQNDPLDANDPPQKLLIPFDVAPYLKSHTGDDRKYWRLKTPAYNYRIDLTCNKAA